VSGSPLIVKFEGIDSREAAHRLSGAYLEVPAEAAHQLPSGAYYHYQLIGLRVSTESGRDLGVLEEVLGGPGNDIWVVKSHSGQHLVPALRSVVELVDLAKGTVLVKDWVLDSEEIRSGEADAV
jgi:16S rRNA processing protein RimM